MDEDMDFDFGGSGALQQTYVDQEYQYQPPSNGNHDSKKML
jgi:hypothetical protein